MYKLYTNKIINKYLQKKNVGTKKLTSAITGFINLQVDYKPINLHYSIVNIALLY